MATFQYLNGQRIGKLIRGATSRVVLCAPGFDDDAASALINVHRELGPSRVHVVVDASDRAARLGYGYFDALKMVTEHGVKVRVEAGLRLGVLIVDSHGWCFSVPPLLVDDTMEQGGAPNAIQLSPTQIAAVLGALLPVASTTDSSVLDDNHAESDDDARSQTSTGAELGRIALTKDVVNRIDIALAQNPPQKFDIARKVHVFNSYFEFVELTLTGVEIERQRITLPPDLILAVTDASMTERINANFRLIDENADLIARSTALRDEANAIRKTYTRQVPRFGAVVLRTTKPILRSEFAALERKVAEFAGEVRSKIAAELANSREGLVEALMPHFRDSPPQTLRAEVSGPVTHEVVRRWLHGRLDRVFPDPDKVARQMVATLTFKSVTYETLTDNKFKDAVQRAYPHEDFTKPFDEFIAAKEAD